MLVLLRQEHLLQRHLNWFLISDNICIPDLWYRVHDTYLQVILNHMLLLKYHVRHRIRM